MSPGAQQVRARSGGTCCTCVRARTHTDIHAHKLVVEAGHTYTRIHTHTRLYKYLFTHALLHHRYTHSVRAQSGGTCCTCVRARTHVHIHTRTHTRLYISIHTYALVRHRYTHSDSEPGQGVRAVRVCVHVHTHIHVYTNIYSHMQLCIIDTHIQ